MSATEEYILCDEENPHEVHNLVMSIFGWICFLVQMYWCIKLLKHLCQQTKCYSTLYAKIKATITPKSVSSKRNSAFDFDFNDSRSNRSKISTKYIILGAVSVVSFSFLLLIYSIGQTVCYFVWLPNDEIYSIRAIGISFYGIGFVCLLFQFTIRLKDVFSETPYQLQRFQLRCLFFLWCFVTCLCIIALITTFILHYYIGILLAALSLLFYVIYSFILLYAFLRRSYFVSKFLFPLLEPSIRSRSKSKSKSKSRSRSSINMFGINNINRRQSHSTGGTGQNDGSNADGIDGTDLTDGGGGGSSISSISSINYNKDKKDKVSNVSSVTSVGSGSEVGQSKRDSCVSQAEFIKNVFISATSTTIETNNHRSSMQYNQYSQYSQSNHTNSKSKSASKSKSTSKHKTKNKTKNKNKNKIKIEPKHLTLVNSPSGQSIDLPDVSPTPTPTPDTKTASHANININIIKNSTNHTNTSNKQEHKQLENRDEEDQYSDGYNLAHGHEQLQQILETKNSKISENENVNLNVNDNVNRKNFNYSHATTSNITRTKVHAAIALGSNSVSQSITNTNTNNNTNNNTNDTNTNTNMTSVANTTIITNITTKTKTNTNTTSSPITPAPEDVDVPKPQNVHVSKSVCLVPHLIDTGSNQTAGSSSTPGSSRNHTPRAGTISLPGSQANSRAGSRTGSRAASPDVVNVGGQGISHGGNHGQHGQHGHVPKIMRSRSTSLDTIAEQTRMNQMIFLKSVGKYSVLVSVSVLSTFMSAMFFILRTIFHSKAWFYVVACYVIIDSVINTICIVYQFTNFDQSFEKRCGYCRYLCQKLMVFRTSLSKQGNDDESDQHADFADFDRDFGNNHLPMAPTQLKLVKSRSVA